MVRKGVRDYISNLKIFVSHHEVPNNEMKITIMNYTKKMKLFYQSQVLLLIIYGLPIKFVS